ncbi:MAG TPA: PSD1 and planctomycete cytochrome C domain-containing protein [Pirellulales bacterium]|nr:PSD1 and planctomycete cytochrome C domain-containing protein [Pirellulales bacterium]
MRPANCLVLAALLFAGRAALAEGGSAELTYEQHVRPILKAHCFQCHGEEGQRKGGLDLRLKRFIEKGGESGPAIVPGNPDESLLAEKIRSEEMPPVEKKLSAAQVETIVHWIAAGAKTARPEPEQVGEGPIFSLEERDYWAFQPVRRPAVPICGAGVSPAATPPNIGQAGRLHHNEQVRTTIDAFLLARLEREGLTFSPEADRPTLIRRAYFDLVGLPPTPEEVEAFVADTSPDAWERVVDRLLASPHYGERWGRHWLDVAGYADSEGYTDEDTPRASAFRYRDYVIRSFNADKPFDQFIQEQLAGDELVPPPYKNLSAEAIDKLTATGFLRMSPDGTASGGVDQNVARNQVVADTLQIVGTSLFGMTLHCAQCHDHRYDPIPQADYYRLRAIFEPALDWKNWRSPPAREVSLYTDDDRALAQKIQAQAAEVDAERARKAQEFIDRTLEEELLLVPEKLREGLRIAYKTADKDRTPEQKAVLKEYPSVANISVGSLYLYDQRRDVKARQIETKRKQDEQQFVTETRARELAKVPEAERAAVETAAAAPVEKRTAEQTAMIEKYPGVLVTAATLGQFNADAAAELAKDAETAAELRATKAADNLKRYSEKAAEIRAKIPPEEFVRALTEVPGQASPTFVFHRGDFQQPKEQVSPGDLTILAAATATDIPADDANLPTTGRRLAFARHLTDGRHPLVARVIVNRVWLHHFGRGLVGTPGDFGVLGERPTHPELLDWLAAGFMDHGWSVKHLHRLIMTSAAYRQSSRRNEKADAVDPENRLYARMSVRRLESETVRDAILSIGGQRHDKMFGPPVPVMEDEVGQIVIGRENLDGERKPTGPVSLGGDEYRRSLYVQMRRSRPLGMLETFDAPIMSPNCECRNISTVASQSLVFMNSAFVIESAKQFAARLEREAGADRRHQLARGWMLALGRRATDDELNGAETFLNRQLETVKGQSAENDPTARNHQALATFCQALLSANAFLYVD